MYKVKNAPAICVSQIAGAFTFKTKGFDFKLF